MSKAFSLILHLKKARIGHEKKSQIPTRATWYNYFADLDAAFPGGIGTGPLAPKAAEFAALHPGKAEKFYRKLGPWHFRHIWRFLVQGGYIVL